jgi:O-methyltransferase involved in polyketide biosynthesis
LDLIPISLAREEHHSDLHANDYHLIGADLRQHNELWNKFQHAELDPKIPTIILAECVLVYIDQLKCDDLLKSFAQYFENCAFINYEQVIKLLIMHFLLSGQHERQILFGNAVEFARARNSFARIVCLRIVGYSEAAFCSGWIQSSGCVDYAGTLCPAL